MSSFMWSPSLILCGGHPSKTSRTRGCVPSLLQFPLCLGILNLGQILSSAPQRAAEHIIRRLTLESVILSSGCVARPSQHLSFLIHKMGIKIV